MPAPPASLTAAQKKEYLELQRKLALHAKKKALGSTAKTTSQAQASGKKTQQQLLLASKLKRGQNTKDKLVTKKGGKASPLNKPVSAQVAAVKGKVRSNSEPSILPLMERKRRAESGGSCVARRARNNTGLPQGGQVRGQKGEELRKGSDVMLQRRMEREEVEESAEVKKKLREMEETVQRNKAVVEKCQGELTTLTHQLTDTVSEIEELELKMENLRKALKVS